MNGAFTFERLAVLAAGAALACSAAAAQAQQDASPQLPPDASNSRLLPGGEVEQQGDIRYISGGVGDIGKQRTLQLGRDMNLQLVFAMPNGAYLADVEVQIADPAGNEVLSLDASEPLLLAQVPPGRYEVTANAGGQRIQRSIEVPAQGRQVEYFHWRAPVEATTASR